MKYLILLLLSACSATGSVYSEPEKPKADMAQIIVYHPSGEFTGSLGGSPNVKFDGQTVCSLPNGSYFTKSVSPGPLTISSTKMLSIGTSSLTLQTKPNQRYYIQITWNGSKVWSEAGAGLIGEAFTEVSSSNSGPFVIESTHNPDLSELKESICSTNN